MARRPAPPQYEAVTDGVRIRVRTRFLHDESEPGRGRYMWSYTIDVENESDRTWTIARRHWRIVDSVGRMVAVDGEGVLAPSDLQMLFTPEFIALNFRVIETGEPLPGIPSRYN